MSLAKELLEKYIKVNEVSKELTARANAKASYLYSDETPTNRPYLRAAFDAQGNTGQKTYAKPGDQDHTNAKQYFQSLMQRKRDGKSDLNLKSRHDARVADYNAEKEPDYKESPDYTHYQKAKEIVGTNVNAIKARGTQEKPLADVKPYLKYYQNITKNPPEQLTPEQRQKRLLPINGEPKGGWRNN